MHDGRRRHVSADGDRWRNEHARSEQRARIEHGVAAHFRTVAHNGAELPQPGFIGRIGGSYHDGLLVQPKIGADDARSEMRVIAQD